MEFIYASYKKKSNVWLADERKVALIMVQIDVD